MTTVPEKVQQAYGSIPAGWRLERLKFYADVRNSNVDKTISDDEEPVQLCNYTDVYYNDRITRELEFKQGSATEAEIEKFQLKRGQVIITKDSEGWDDIGIPALVTEDMPDVLCGYHLSVFEPGPDLDGAFLAWLCRSDPLNDQFKLGANGVTRYGLGQYPMKNALVALPPIESQRQIARFLDEKTAQIDGLIEKKRALLDRLAEKRQALITRAVTKGLDPAAPMKPSGIDWLGDVPAHWEVLPIKRRVLSIEQGWSPSAEERLAANDEWGVLKSGCVNDGRFNETEHKTLPADVDPRPKLEVNKGDILMCRASGSLRYIGSVALVERVRPKLMFSDKTYRISLSNEEACERFFVYSMAAKHLREQIVLSVSGAEGLANNIAQSSVGRYVHSFPPLSEQREIANYLARALGEQDDIARSISRTIEYLTEYRAALITAAVTGKLTELQ